MSGRTVKKITIKVRSTKTDEQNKSRRGLHYEKDPRMKVVRQFLCKSIPDDPKFAHPGDMIFWTMANELLELIDAATAVNGAGGLTNA